MDTLFYCLHDFMLATKTMTYIFMGLGVVCLLGYWCFLTGRDESIRKF